MNARLPFPPDRTELNALVRRAQDDDLAAQSELVRRYRTRISRFIRSIISQPSAVEDVAQNVFIKMSRRLRLLRDPQTFEAWLFTLSRNTAFDFIRTRHCRPITVSSDRQLFEAPDTGNPQAVEEIMEALEFALTHLSPIDRTLVGLVVQGHSYSTVAAQAGLTPGAVKARLNRVRPFLRSSVGRAIGTRPSPAETRCAPPASRAAA